MAASGGRCWLRALWFLQVTKLRLREVQLTTQGHTAVEVVREPGQSHSRARSLVSRRWPLVASFSSTLLTSLCSSLGRALSAHKMELLGEKFRLPCGPPGSCPPFGGSPPPALQPVDPPALSLPWPGHSCLCLVPWPLGRHVEEQRRVPGWGNPAAGHSARDRKGAAIACWGERLGQPGHSLGCIPGTESWGTPGGWWRLSESRGSSPEILWPQRAVMVASGS